MIYIFPSSTKHIAIWDLIMPHFFIAPSISLDFLFLISLANTVLPHSQLLRLHLQEAVS